MINLFAAAFQAGAVGAKAVTAWGEKDEALRRLREQNRQLLGQATAAAGASGVEMQGSLQDYLTGMREELKRQEQWTRRSMETNIYLGAFGGGMNTFASAVSNAGSKR